MIVERFCPIPGWEKFYSVSDKGRVFSHGRTIKVLNPHGVLGKRTYRPKVLKESISVIGYPVVNFTRPRKRVRFYVHDLVLLAFIGPKPKNLEVCHNDGNKRNNQLKNLRYDTQSANNRDRVKHRHGGEHGPTTRRAQVRRAFK